MRLLVGALLLAPLVTVVDAFARARRRRQPVVPWLRWLAATAVPFLAAVLFAALLGLADLVPAAPRQPVPPDALPFDGPARIALASVGLVFVLAWLLARGPLVRPWGVVRSGDDGAVVALLLALVGLAVATWVVNPWAGALFVPAAHLWLLFGAPELRLRRAAGLAVVLAGALPFGLLLLSVAGQLGMGPGEALWFCLLLVAGGHASPALWLLWSLVAACFVLAAALAWRVRPPEPEVPITRPTLRGPLTYAGPGSLGGTESALRR